MRVEMPDPEYSASPRAARNFVFAFRLAFGCLAVMWSVFVFDQLFELGLIRFGLVPREGAGLIGLVTAPLLHYNLAHIGSNSLPLLVGGTMMLFLYPNSSMRALPLIWLGSGLLAWVYARTSVHIGASGLIYGLLTFVFISGVIRRDLRSIGAALFIWFMYGSMVWGVLPVRQGMSWELHSSGALLGALLAWRYRAWDRPPMKRYAWEDEIEDEEPDDAAWREEPRQ